VVPANAAVESAIIPRAKIMKYFFIFELLLVLESPGSSLDRWASALRTVHS
jgi:hypothetical protein